MYIYSPDNSRIRLKTYDKIIYVKIILYICSMMRTPIDYNGLTDYYYVPIIQV